MDLFVVSKVGGKHITTVFRNLYQNDAFFVSVSVLNGVECQNGNCVDHPYGANYNGACYKLLMTDTKGAKRISEHCQLSSLSHNSLQASKTVIGLGRTNNYIDSLVVRTMNGETNTFRNIIPNSAVVINPIKDDWRFELFMNPNSNIVGILMVLVFSMACMAGVIFVLDRVEKKQDLEERRKRLHTINYDAL